MDNGLLSLKWNNHCSSFIHMLASLCRKDSFCDVTLACEGKFYPSHKLVLSTCSNYFQEMFQQTQCKHPVIVLKDICSQDLEALLNYMYLGEVNVAQEKLSTLIKTAECLRIKGLAVPDNPVLDSSSSRDKRNSKHRNDGMPESKRRKMDIDHKSKDSHCIISKRPTNNADSSYSFKKPLVSKGQIVCDPSHKQIDQRVCAPSCDDKKDSDPGHRDFENVEGQLECFSDRENHSYYNKNKITLSNSIKQEPVDHFVEENTEEGVLEVVHSIFASPGIRNEISSTVNVEASEMQEIGVVESESADRYSSSAGVVESESAEKNELSGENIKQNKMNREETIKQEPPDHFVDEEDDTNVKLDSRPLHLTTILQEEIPSAEKMESSNSLVMDEPNWSTDYLPPYISYNGNLAEVSSSPSSKPSLVCHLCKYEVKRPADMHKHLRIHTGEKPFVCNICSYSTAQSSNLRTHMRMKHL